MEDFSACPVCDFPALHSEFLKYLLFKLLMCLNFYIIYLFLHTYKNICNNFALYSKLTVLNYCVRTQHFSIISGIYHNFLFHFITTNLIVRVLHLLRLIFKFCLFSRLLETETVCPMCSQRVDVSNVTKTAAVEKYLHPQGEE